MSCHSDRKSDPWSPVLGQEAFQRARSPERKEQRRSAILQAASAVLAREGVEATSLNGIAREAGMVKSNLYRYFESREEILLRLMLLDFTDLLDDLEGQVKSGHSLREVASVFADGFVRRPRLCQFISQLAITLERNVSGAVLREIKLDLMGKGGRAVAALGVAMPNVSEEGRLQAVHLLFSLVAGHWPMSNPTGELKTLLAEPQFAAFNHDFASFLRDGLVTVLTGIAQNAADDKTIGPA